MSKTAENLIDEVAGILGKNVPGEPLAAIDHDVIDGKIDGVLEETARIVYIGDRDDIPDGYFQPIARLVAIHAAASFSNGQIDYDAVERHEQRLRVLVAQVPTRETIPVEFM